MRHAKSPAQQKKEHRKRRSYEAADPGTPPVYGTGWVLSWADLALGRGVPPESSMSFLYLLYYHKADVTSQIFGRSRQNDVLHDAYQFNGRIGPRPNLTPPQGGVRASIEALPPGAELLVQLKICAQTTRGKFHTLYTSRFIWWLVSCRDAK